MDAIALISLKTQLEFAALIEQCQTLNLITPAERQQYAQSVKEKVTAELEAIKKLV